jgi:hypothetical protein
VSGLCGAGREPGCTAAPRNAVRLPKQTPGGGAWGFVPRVKTARGALGCRGRGNSQSSIDELHHFTAFHSIALDTFGRSNCPIVGNFSSQCADGIGERQRIWRDAGERSPSNRATTQRTRFYIWRKKKS